MLTLPRVPSPFVALGDTFVGGMRSFRIKPFSLNRFPSSLRQVRPKHFEQHLCQLAPAPNRQPSAHGPRFQESWVLGSGFPAPVLQVLLPNCQKHADAACSHLVFVMFLAGRIFHVKDAKTSAGCANFTLGSLKALQEALGLGYLGSLCHAFPALMTATQGKPKGGASMAGGSGTINCGHRNEQYLAWIPVPRAGKIHAIYAYSLDCAPATRPRTPK